MCCVAFHCRSNTISTIDRMSLQAAGKYKQKGRDYIVEDGDIIHFKFNAGAGLTGKKK